MPKPRKTESPPTEGTRRSMKANRSTETTPEVKLRQELWRRGIRGYRKNWKKLPGKPDLVFLRAKIAVFVHGCFWHQCPTCQRNLTPTKNGGFWQTKFEATIKRDAANREKLEALGFQVIIVWECDIKANVEKAADSIKRFRDHIAVG